MGSFRSTTSATSRKENDSIDIDSNSNVTSSKHSFSRNDQLHSARDKLEIAIKSEQAADEALIHSRASVKAARIEIAILEKEASREQKIAQRKTDEVKRVRKAGDQLGKY